VSVQSVSQSTSTSSSVETKFNNLKTPFISTTPRTRHTHETKRNETKKSHVPDSSPPLPLSSVVRVSSSRHPRRPRRLSHCAQTNVHSFPLTTHTHPSSRAFHRTASFSDAFVFVLAFASQPPSRVALPDRPSSSVARYECQDEIEIHFRYESHGILRVINRHPVITLNETPGRRQRRDAASNVDERAVGRRRW